MSIEAGYFGNLFNFKNRFFPDNANLAQEVTRLKQLGLKIVLTMGSFDLLHIGHCNYLRLAKELGDVLIVGIESDEKIQQRKGKNRPAVPLAERAEMVAHTRYVDLVTVKNATDPKWQLIKLIRPDVLQAVEGMYSDEELAQLRDICGEVVVQGRQAQTSTSAKIRLLIITGMDDLTEHLATILPTAITEFIKDAVEKAKETKT